MLGLEWYESKQSHAEKTLELLLQQRQECESEKLLDCTVIGEIAEIQAWRPMGFSLFLPACPARKM